MQDQQILNSTITIEEIVDKGKKISIKGNSGRVHTYSIWKSKQDGSDSATYSQFKTMGLQVGSTVMVGYVIDEYDTEINGIPKRVQSKKIINFRESNAQPTQTSAPVKSSNLGHSVSSQSHSSNDKDDAFWEKQAYEKCCSLWAASIMQKEASGDAVNIARRSMEGGLFWDLFQAIKADGNKRFSPLRQAVQKHAPSVVEELPTIQIEDEVDVEGIPF